MKKPVAKHLELSFEEFKAQLTSLGDKEGIRVNHIAHADAIKTIYVFCADVEEGLRDYQDFVRRWNAVKINYQ